jgi:AraC-like DNA-binding protein/DNA-binding protein Fis
LSERQTKFLKSDEQSPSRNPRTSVRGGSQIASGVLQGVFFSPEELVAASSNLEGHILNQSHLGQVEAWAAGASPQNLMIRCETVEDFFPTPEIPYLEITVIDLNRIQPTCCCRDPVSVAQPNGYLIANCPNDTCGARPCIFCVIMCHFCGGDMCQSCAVGWVDINGFNIDPHNNPDLYDIQPVCSECLWRVSYHPPAPSAALRNPVFSRGTSFSKEPKRTYSTAQLAEHLKVNQETVRRWARSSDIPHDVIVGEKIAEQIRANTKRLEDISRKAIKFDPEEARFWYLSQTAEGKRLPKLSRIPLEEGRARLKAVMQQLKLSTTQLASLLGENRMTLNGYLYGKHLGKVTSIPTKIITYAEGLTEDDIPLSNKSVPKKMLENALIINEGHIANTARELGMHPTTLKKRAMEAGLGHLLRAKPNFKKQITPTDVTEALVKHQGHVKSVASELKCNRTTLYRLFHSFGIDPEQYRSRSKQEVHQALRKWRGNRGRAAKQLDIGVTVLRQLVAKYGLEREFPAFDIIKESKLDLAEVGKALKRFKYNIQKTAKKFGVSTSYMNKFVKRWNLRY